MEKEMRKVLTIAGSDCSGGAGIQADIKTITVHGMYAMSVITALTAQNTQGVYGIAQTDPSFVALQLDCIFKDIRPDAVKIGMVANAAVIRVIAEKLLEYDAKNIVVDPVMVATSGGKLLLPEGEEALQARLLPLAHVTTPNLPETEALCGFPIGDEEGVIGAAKILSSKFPGTVLIKGGHFTGGADDFLWDGKKGVWFREKRIDSSNTHGTGCTLSSAIACNLAAGFSVEESVRNAKRYLTGAIHSGLDLGGGNGPLNHMYAGCGFLD